MNDSRSGFGSLYMPRSRGAVSGLLLIILGFWGALIPFVGPYFHFAYTPDQAWAWSTARAWLEVFPGVVTVVGGVLLLISGNRATATFGGWLAVMGGVWYVVGRTLAPTSRLQITNVGQPIGTTDAKRALLELCYFSGLGVLIVLLAAAVLGRVSVRTVRDVEFAHQAQLSPPAEATGAFAAPAAAADAPTVAAPQTHRRSGKSGFFRRRREGATSH
jgi:hypothetical protein